MDEPNHDSVLSPSPCPSTSLAECPNEDSIPAGSPMNETHGIITPQMVREEKDTPELTAKEEAKLKKDYEKQKHNEEKEERYKQLMHLLSKSQFYSSFLLEKLKKSKTESDKNDLKKRSEKDEKNNETPINEVLEVNNSEEVNFEGNNDKACVTDLSSDSIKSSNNHSPSRKRKADFLDFNDSCSLILEVEEDTSEEETIEESIEIGKNIDVEDDQGNLIKKTKITNLGLEVPIGQPDLLEGGILRNYQIEGVSWLKLLFENGMNGILADEMGLGKTVQLIAHICFLIERNVRGPYLIVAPLSTLNNWMLEFKKFAPQVPVILFHGSEQTRNNHYLSISKNQKVGNHSTKPVVITSYEIPMKEVKKLSSIEWQYIVVDEGHRIKNPNSLLSKVLSKIPSKNRLLLTGTPLQNNLTELWALLNFLLPELFDDLSTFESWFDVEAMDNAKEAEKIVEQEQEQKIISVLHQILFPFLLRRTKADVKLDIPPKKEVMVYCPMTPLQLELYKVIVDHLLANLENDNDLVHSKRKSMRSVRSEDLSSSSRHHKKSPSSEFFPLDKMPACKEHSERLGLFDSEGRSLFFNRLPMQSRSWVLRHIVNHPYLVRMPIRYDEKGNKSMYITEDLKHVSGKLLVLDAMLSKLKEKGHKVLLFCTSSMMLDIIEEYAILERYSYVRLDGSTKLNDRRDSIYAFNTDPSIFLFLLSTRAGGLGVNLIGADTVILYNSDWNPQVDLQAQDRAHRIGQIKPVVVYRFNVAGTVDDKVIIRAQSKRKLEKIVMKKGAFNLAKQNELLDLQELRELLETTDTLKTVQSNGFIFSDEELEELLDRSDLVVDVTEDNFNENTNSRNKFFEILNLQSNSLPD